MNKRNLFISAGLTSFLLIILTGVAAAAKLGLSTSNTSQVDGMSAQASVLQPTENPPAVAVQNSSPILSAQDAAQIAASFLGQSDLYSAENSVWNGAPAYKVVFSSGYIVYVGMDGQLLAIEAPQTAFQNNFRFQRQPEHEEHEGNEGFNDD